MKLLSVKFRNFRLLQDIDLSFSQDPQKNLTVIRAANDTGKTTILTALQWGLFGEEHLPNKGIGFRMHPIDWDFEKDRSVNISVEIEFEHTWQRPTGNGKFIKETQRYLVCRTAVEQMRSSGDWKRESSHLALFEVNETGHRDIPNAEARLKQVMGSNLKGLFFTDGDRALTFITAELSKSDRRRLVKTAISDMLSFEVLNNSKKHIQNSVKRIIDETKSIDNSQELEDTTIDLTKCSEEVERLSSRSDELNKAVSEAQVDVNSDQKRLEEALAAGNREDLEQQLKRYNSELTKKLEELETLRHSHGSLFLLPSLTSVLLEEKIVYLSELLDKLKKKGVIPKTALPILQERLDIGVCICGTNLQEGTKAHSSIIQLIKQHESQSDLDDLITDLKFSNDRAMADVSASKDDWLEQAQNILSARNKCEEDIDYIRGILKKTENEIELLPDINIKLMREKLSASRSNSDRLNRDQALNEHDLKQARGRKVILDAQHQALLKQTKSANKVLAKFDAANDILEVIDSSFHEIEEIEIPKVSESMNTYFLEMIQSDQEVNKIIHHAEVTGDYEIKVLSAQNRVLDTDNDLNGASRRALTLSFILALAKVSGVEAPNVIDTPFGMMDPIVKGSTLEVLTREASQVILLLTRSEINDIEELLTDKTGAVSTLTNVAHYPMKVVNKPATEDNRTVKCDCDHIHYCRLCERKGEAKKEGRLMREEA